MAPSLILDRMGSFLLGGEHNHRVMNRSKIREVLWVELPGLEPVVLKKYHPLSLPRALWNCLKGTQWRREWATSLLLLQMEVPAPKPLLCAERLKKGIPLEGFLVTKAIQEAQTLTQELQAEAQERSSLLKALGLYLAGIHARGILHRDLHAENLLVGRSHGGSPVFWLLDLHRVRTGKSLNQRQRKWNLAQILLSLRQELLPGEERLLLEAYLAAFAPGESWDSWSKCIRKTQGRMLRKHQRSRTRRCLKDSSGFAREVIPGGRVIRKRDFPLEAVLKVLEQARGTLDKADPRLLKDSGPTRVYQFKLELQDKPVVLCIKEHTLRGPLIVLLKQILPSRARRFWVGAWGMIVRGFLVPAPMAMWEMQRDGAFCSGIIMELIQDGLRMDQLVASLASNGKAKRQLMKDLASTLSRMHSQGIFHRDLKATNLMVRKTPGGNEILFLDLEDVSFGQRVERAKVALNLAQLDESIPESVGTFSRLRFLRMYLGKDHSRHLFRNLSREVGRLSLQRRKKA